MMSSFLSTPTSFPYPCGARARVCVSVCVCVCACARARACVRSYVRARVCVCVCVVCEEYIMLVYIFVLFEGYMFILILSVDMIWKARCAHPSSSSS